MAEAEQSISSSEEDSDSDDDDSPQVKHDLISLRTTMVVSADDKLLVAVHQNSIVWEAFLWNVAKRKFVARIAENRPLHLKYPQFSADSAFVVSATRVECG